MDALVGYDEATKNAIKERIESEEPFGDLLTGADPATEQQLIKRPDLVDKINALAASADVIPDFRRFRRDGKGVGA